MLSTEYLQQGKVCYNIQLKLEKMYGLSSGIKKTVPDNELSVKRDWTVLWRTPGLHYCNHPLIAN